MNKRITRKIFTAFAVATLFIGGAVAQTHNGTTVPGAGANYVSGATQTEMWMTVGTTVPAYAQPDPYYHPNYDAAGGNYTLTDNFSWTWTETPTGTGNLTITQSAADDNYVTFSTADVDDYAITVAEGSPTCTDATPSTLTLHAIAAPTAAFTTAGDSVTCGDLALQAVNMTITENISLATMGRYAFSVVMTVDTFDYATSAWVNIPASSSTIVDWTLATKGTPSGAFAAGAWAHSFNTPAMPLVNSRRTRYLFSLENPTDYTGAGSGMASVISANSDYIAIAAGSEAANTTLYGFGTDVMGWVVNPVPVTGPIYHISNTWAQ
jgi:hypothetical protein